MEQLNIYKENYIQHSRWQFEIVSLEQIQHPKF